MCYVFFGLLCFMFGCSQQETDDCYYTPSPNLNFNIQFPKTEPKPDIVLPEPPKPEGQISNDIIELDADKNLDDIRMSSYISVVDFGAVWCIPCKNLKGELQKIADDNSEVSFYYADIDTCPSLRESAGDIRQVPTVIIYKGGEEFKRIIGNDPDGIRSAISEAGE